jgi:hypothetical protein
MRVPASAPTPYEIFGLTTRVLCKANTLGLSVPSALMQDRPHKSTKGLLLEIDHASLHDLMTAHEVGKRLPLSSTDCLYEM